MIINVGGTDRFFSKKDCDILIKSISDILSLKLKINELKHFDVSLEQAYGLFFKDVFNFDYDNRTFDIDYNGILAIVTDRSGELGVVDNFDVWNDEEGCTIIENKTFNEICSLLVDIVKFN